MKEDIKEIKSIIEEMVEGGIYPSEHKEAVSIAVQIQRNRILERAFFELHPNGRGGFFQLSNLQKIAENS